MPRPSKLPRFQEIKNQIRDIIFNRAQADRWLPCPRASSDRAVTPLIYLGLLRRAGSVGVALLKVPTWILPAPRRSIEAAVKWAPELALNSLVTLRETVLGFVLAHRAVAAACDPDRLHPTGAAADLPDPARAAVGAQGGAWRR